jgi:hypothetical protein
MEAPEPRNPRKRRWCWRQYSVSTLLIVITIVSVGLGVVTSRAQRQRRAVAAIRELGGTVRYDFQPEDDGPVYYLGRRVNPAWTPSQPPGPAWLHKRLGVDYFADVVSVRAHGMTDATCSHLSALTSLQELHLYGTQVTDAGLAHLAGLTNLKKLGLFEDQVSDAGLAHLTGLTRLELLMLRGTQVTNAGLDKLREALPNVHFMTEW